MGSEDSMEMSEELWRKIPRVEAEPSSFPSVSTFRGELKVDLDDPDVVYLRAYSIQDENLLVSARRTRRHAWGDR